MARECYRIEALPSGDLLAYTDNDPANPYAADTAFYDAWKPDGSPLLPRPLTGKARDAAREALPAWAATRLPPSGREAREARKARAAWWEAEQARRREAYFAAEARAMDALCAALGRAGAQYARGKGTTRVTAEGVTFLVKVAPAEGE